MNAKGKQWVYIIEAIDKSNNKFITHDDLLQYLKDNEDIINYFAFILHDEDVDLLGEKKHLHYHLCIDFKNVYAKKTVLMDLVRYLEINVTCVTCSLSYDFVSAIRYLTHLDDKDKHQYNDYDVYSSDYETYDIIISKRVYDRDIDIDSLVNLVNTSKTLTEVLKKLGLKNSKLYLHLVLELWKRRNDYGR